MSKRMIEWSVAAALVSGSVIALASTQPPPDSERKATEADVPKAALDTLKKQAGGAAITEFAEEIEHGNKFYEGSWKGPNGNIDCLVTEAGALVEIEESIPADMAPGATRAAAQNAAGKDAKLSFEKKTMVMYEIHFQKDGKGHEVILTPDGRVFHEEGGDEPAGEEEEEEGR